MKRWKVIVISFLVCVVAWVTIAVLARKDEPSWHGKTLTEWLDRAQAIYISDNKTPGEDPIKALNEMGTSVAPTLIKMLEANDGEAKTKLIGLANRQKLIRVHFRTASEKVSSAMNAFRLMGTNAISALPQMLRLTQNRDKGTSGFATTAVAKFRRFDPSFREALEGCLTNRDPEIRRAAAQFLIRFYPLEADRLGVREMFTDLKGPDTNSVQTNSPPAK